CEALGVCHPGCRKPGFVPWHLLIDPSRVHRGPNPIAQCVRGLSHWTHAKHVMKHELPWLSALMLESAYRALLKAHLFSKIPPGPKARNAALKLINNVFVPRPIVRGVDGWVDAKNLNRTADTAGVDFLVKALPAVHFVGPRGGTGSDPTRIGTLLGRYD